MTAAVKSLRRETAALGRPESRVSWFPHSVAA
jgi:hypothetical protein